MIKKLLAYVLTLFLFALSAKGVFAGGFNLKSIGGLNTDGRQISHWWYSSTNAPLTGEATPDSTINITIDEVSASATADTEGMWSYNPSGLSEGDHEISLENNGSTIKFTLTLGADNMDMAAIEKDGNPTALPAAGTTAPTLLLLTLGIGLFFTGRKFLKQA